MKHSKQQFLENLLKLSYHRDSLEVEDKVEVDDYFDKIINRDNTSLLYTELYQNNESDL